MPPTSNNRQAQDPTAIANADFDKAISLLKTRFGTAGFESELRILARQVCYADLSRLKEVLARLPSDEMKRQVASTTIQHWAKQDPERLLRFSEESLTGDLKNSAYASVIHEYSQKGEFRTAAGVLQRMPFSLARESMLTSLASSWAGLSIGDAMEWAASLESVEDRSRALSALAVSAGASADVGILQKLAAMPEETVARKAALEELGILFAKRDGIPAVKKWIKSLPRDDRDPVIMWVVGEVRKSDSDAATELALSMANTHNRIVALLDILEIQFKSSPQDAAAWTLALNKQGPEKEAVIRDFVSRWYDTDSLQLSVWINGLPTGVNRDYALYQLALKVAPKDRKQSAEIASQIQNEKLRASALRP